MFFYIFLLKISRKDAEPQSEARKTLRPCDFA